MFENRPICKYLVVHPIARPLKYLRAPMGVVTCMLDGHYTRLSFLNLIVKAARCLCDLLCEVNI